MIQYQYKDFIFEFLMQQGSLRIPACHSYHKRLVNSFPWRTLGAVGAKSALKKAVDSGYKLFRETTHATVHIHVVGTITME